MRGLGERLAQRSVEIALTPEARQYIIDQGFNPEYGARPLRRAIQRIIEDPLAEEVLRGSFPDGSRIRVTYVNGQRGLRAPGHRGRGRRRRPQPAPVTAPAAPADEIQGLLSPPGGRDAGPGLFSRRAAAPEPRARGSVPTRVPAARRGLCSAWERRAASARRSRSPLAMPAKLLLSFAVATFIAALASVWVLAEVRRPGGVAGGLRRHPARGRPGGAVRRPRLHGPQGPACPGARPRGEPGAPFPAPRAAPAGAEDVPPSGEAPSPLESRDPLVKLDHLIKKADELSNDAYDVATTTYSGDLMALKREMRQLKAMLATVLQGLAAGRPGAGLSLGWGLPPRGAPLDGAKAKAFVEEADRHGIAVEAGRVTAKAMLNISPNKQMPIEYFITRFPESGHETLVHLVGSRTMDDLAKDPVGGLRGLGTALYKALLAAGFHEGEGSRPDPDSTDPEETRAGSCPRATWCTCTCATR